MKPRKTTPALGPCVTPTSRFAEGQIVSVQVSVDGPWEPATVTSDDGVLVGLDLTDGSETYAWADLVRP